MYEKNIYTNYYLEDNYFITVLVNEIEDDYFY